MKKKIKFSSLYNTLSEIEKKDFKLFVSSNLLNGKRNYLVVLNHLDAGKYKNFEEAGTSIKARTLWNRLSELTKLLERFLVFNAMIPSNPAYDLELLKEFKKRNLIEYFEQQLTRTENAIKKSPISFATANLILEFNELYSEYLQSILDSKKFTPVYIKTQNYRIALFINELLEKMISNWGMKNVRLVSSKFFFGRTV